MSILKKELDLRSCVQVIQVEFGVTYLIDFARS